MPALEWLVTLLAGIACEYVLVGLDDNPTLELDGTGARSLNGIEADGTALARRP